MKSRRYVLATGVILTALLAACRTPPPPVATPLNREELRRFFARARDPRNYWITVYDSEQGPLFKGGNRLHPAQLVMLPFESPAPGALPIVKLDAWLGRDFHAFLDTTSARNWITMHAFHAMHGIPFGPPAYRFPVAHVNEDIPGFAGVIPKLRFDNLHIESAVVCVWAANGPFGNLARDVRKPAPDIIIGMDWIESFQFVQIDYPARRVFFSSTFPFRPEADRLLASVPYSVVGGAMAVGGVINGKTTLLLVDTAGDFELASTNVSVEATRQLEIGNLVLRNVEMEDSTIYDLGLLNYPRIGSRLLSRFRITIDPRARMLHFERPPVRKNLISP